VQVLHLSNGLTLNEKLRAQGSVVERFLASYDPQEEASRRLVEEAYLLCLSRFPSAGESARFVSILAQTPAPERREAIEDLFWALMSSREFLFQH
jgi:hypothetical protein